MVWSKEQKLEFKRTMELRTRKFAVSVFRYLNALPKSNSYKVISFQLGKSASSVGANYREANRCESADDFAHKMGIVLKECSETHYWIEVLVDLRPSSTAANGLLKECDELLRIFQTVEHKMKTRKR